MCLLGTMLPPTLVTRWYQVNRGRALGIVTMPLLSAGISPLVALVLTKYGLTAAYMMLAGLMLLLLPALLFVIDYPPNAIDRSGEDVAVRGCHRSRDENWRFAPLGRILDVIAGLRCDHDRTDYPRDPPGAIGDRSGHRCDEGCKPAHRQRARRDGRIGHLRLGCDRLGGATTLS